MIILSVICRYIHSSAWSVLTETEEPTVFGRFFGTETEIEPMLAKFLEPEGNRNRILEPRVPEMSKMGIFWRILITFSVKFD